MKTPMKIAASALLAALTMPSAVLASDDRNGHEKEADQAKPHDKMECVFEGKSYGIGSITMQEGKEMSCVYKPKSFNGYSDFEGARWEASLRSRT